MRKHLKKLVPMWFATLLVCAYLLACPLPLPFSRSIDISLGGLNHYSDDPYTLSGGEVYISGAYNNYLVRADTLAAKFKFSVSHSSRWSLELGPIDFILSESAVFPLGEGKISVREMYPELNEEAEKQMRKAEKKKMCETRFFVGTDFKEVFILRTDPIEGTLVYFTSVDMPREDAISFIDSLAEYF